MWNVAYDSGTVASAVGLGAVTDPFGFVAAFGACGLALLLAGGADGQAGAAVGIRCAAAASSSRWS